MATKKEKEEFVKGAKSSGFMTSTTPFGRFVNKLVGKKRKKDRKVVGRGRRK